VPFRQIIKVQTSEQKLNDDQSFPTPIERTVGPLNKKTDPSVQESEPGLNWWLKSQDHSFMRF